MNQNSEDVKKEIKQELHNLHFHLLTFENQLAILNEMESSPTVDSLKFQKLTRINKLTEFGLDDWIEQLGQVFTENDEIFEDEFDIEVYYSLLREDFIKLTTIQINLFKKTTSFSILFHKKIWEYLLEIQKWGIDFFF